MTVAVVNSGVGNLGAIPNMLARVGASAIVTTDPDVVRRAERVVLPGVGSFDAALRNLESSGVLDALHDKVLVQKAPFLGLCLGMELLADRSEEGRRSGLGWIPGSVVRFRFDGLEPPPRVPHMGWNWVRPTRNVPILQDLGPNARFYFAHSFHFVPDDPADTVGVSTYGLEFAAVIQRENVMGLQFHPEKSHRFGLRVFENFLRL
jgi:glutamine amidotransferase